MHDSPHRVWGEVCLSLRVLTTVQSTSAIAKSSLILKYRSVEAVRVIRHSFIEAIVREMQAVGVRESIGV